MIVTNLRAEWISDAGYFSGEVVAVTESIGSHCGESSILPIHARELVVMVIHSSAAIRHPESITSSVIVERYVWCGGYTSRQTLRTRIRNRSQEVTRVITKG